MGETIPFEEEVDAVDVRADEDGFGIVISNNDSRLAEQKSRVDSLQDIFRSPDVVLDESFLGPVHELQADFQRRTRAARFQKMFICFYCNHSCYDLH
jgi:hypothetical protein